MIPQPQDRFAFALVNMLFSPKSSDDQKLWVRMVAIQAGVEYQSRTNTINRAVIEYRNLEFKRNVLVVNRPEKFPRFIPIRH